MGLHGCESYAVSRSASARELSVFSFSRCCSCNRSGHGCVARCCAARRCARTTLRTLRFTLSLALRQTGGIPWFAIGTIAIGIWTDWLTFAWLARWSWRAITAASRKFWARTAWARKFSPWAAWRQRLAVWAEAWWARAAWPIATWAAGTTIVTTWATEFTRAAFAVTFEVARCRGQLPAHPSAWHFAACWTIVVSTFRLGAVFFSHQAAEAFRFVASATWAAAITAATTAWTTFATFAATAFAAAVVVGASWLVRANHVSDVVEFTTGIGTGWCGFALEYSNQAHALNSITDDFQRFEQARDPFGRDAEGRYQCFGEGITFERGVGGFGCCGAAQREGGEFGQGLHSGGA